MRKTLLALLGIGCILTEMQAQHWAEKMHQLRHRWDTEITDNRKMAESLLVSQMEVAWEQMDLDQMPARDEDKDKQQPSLADNIDISQTEKEVEVSSSVDDINELRPKAGLTNFAYGNRSLPSLTPSEMRLLSSRTGCGYYGKRFLLHYNDQMKIRLGYRLSSAQIARAWSTLQRYYGEKVLFQLLKQAHEMDLNDWGFFVLVNKAAVRLFPQDLNAQTLFNVFCITKAGYIAKLSQDKNRLYLMAPARQTLYSATYLKGRDYKYYVLDLNGKKVNLARANVLQVNYPETYQVLDMNLTKAPDLPPTVLQRNLSFKYANRTYNVKVKLNKNVVHFYHKYPFTDWEVQMATPPSKYVRNSLLPALKEVIHGKSQVDAANMLLRFVQKAFPYKTDHQQFGFENYLFIEETFYYPYNDCEDRSVLFAYLVRELLDLEVVGLVFPGHAATAVRFTEPVSGTYLNHKGKRFVVCDPTYINANVGMTLPEVANKNVKIVSL